MDSNIIKNKVIYVQWTNNFGGLEIISKRYEDNIHNYCTSVLSLKYNEKGIKYKSCIVLRHHQSKFLLNAEYLIYVIRNKSCIFHLQYPGTLILLLTYIAGARRIIFHFHGTKFRLNFLDRIIWKLLINKIQIITNSLHTTSIIKNRISEKIVPVIIPNLIDISKFSYIKRSISIEGKFKIIYAGRFTKGKNINVILETAILLKNRNIEFHLFGEGPEKETLENIKNASGLQSTVYFHPFSKDIKSVYLNSNLLVFLSAYESFGNVVAEALLTGLPVLCNSIPALKEFLIDAIFYTDSLIPDLIASKIIWIIENYNSVQKQTAESSSNLRTILNNKNILERLTAVYDQMALNR